MHHHGRVVDHAVTGRAYTQAKIGILVIGRREGFIETFQFVQQGTACQQEDAGAEFHVAREIHLGRQRRCVAPVTKGRAVAIDDVAGLLHDAMAPQDHPADRADAGIGFETAQRLRNGAGGEFGVVVQIEYGVTGGELQCRVAAKQKADIRVEAEMRRAQYVALDIAGLVGRSGIDQHQIDIARVIRAQRTQRLHRQVKLVMQHH